MKILLATVAGTALFSAVAAFAQQSAEPTPPAAAATPATSTETKPAKKLSYTDDYRIAVNHDADSDGEIVFTVTPKKDGAPQDIKVTIKKGTSENHVAQAIKKAFVEQLGTKHYNIEIEDGENVIIEGSGGRAYSLVLVSSSVQGVKVTIHHD